MRGYYDKFRGDPSLVKMRLRRFVAYFNGYKTVLDMGCGQGDFLNLLKEAGIDSIGIDSDSEAIAVCQAAGHKAMTADIFEYLCGNGGFDGIMASHIIEHFDGPQAEELLHRCHDSINSGGRIIVITPNPENLVVSTKSFWLDPTHRRPYPLDLLVAMLREIGFEIIDFGEDKNTLESSFWLKLKRNIAGPLLSLWGLAQFRKNLYSALDVFVVAQKPSGTSKI